MDSRTLGVLAFTGTAVVSLVVFAVCAGAGVELGADFGTGSAGILLAGAGVGLLTVDAVVPVPSSAVIAGLGAAFGFPLGSLLSVVGLVAGSAVGYACGAVLRRSASVNDGSDPEDAGGWRASDAAIVALRGVPVLGEAVAVAAGARGMGCPRFLVLAAVGSVPVAVLGTLLGDAVG